MGSVFPRLPSYVRIFSRLRMDLLRALRVRMDELNLSQRELAERSGIRESVVSRMMQGEFNPTFRTVARLAVAVGDDLVQVNIQPCQKKVSSAPVLAPTGADKTEAASAFARKESEVQGWYRLPALSRSTQPLESDVAHEPELLYINIDDF